MFSYMSNCTLTNVFDTGKFTTTLQSVESGTYGPPKPLLVAAPIEAGVFPLLLFLHGFMLSNSFYSQLISHIASHGFIVIAPQLYIFAGPDASGDIRSAAAVINWLSGGLSEFLPSDVKPDYNKLAVAGHSRGGKDAFALVLRKLNVTTNLKFMAVIGVDPVDGTEKGKQTPPPVLTYVPHSFDFDMPAMVIGSGFGAKRTLLFPACAPKGVNHEDFFIECTKPSWYFVSKDYGHFDVLDDDTWGIFGLGTYYLCKNGDSRKPMRRFVAGAMVAFLEAYLQGDYCDLTAVRDGRETLPLELKTVKCCDEKLKGCSLADCMLLKSALK